MIRLLFASPLRMGLLGVLLLAGWTNAKADSVDNFVLSDGMGNTMTWTLPSSPTSVFVDGSNGFIIDGVSIVVNGTTEVTEDLEFFTLSDFGGLEDIATSGGTSGGFVNLFGPQLFNGPSLSSPTFVPGDYSIPSSSFSTWEINPDINPNFTLEISSSAAAPEPGSLVFIAIGLGALLVIRKRMIRPFTA